MPRPGQLLLGLPVLLSALCTVPAGASSCLEISVCSAYASAEIPMIFRGEAVNVVHNPPPPLPAGMAVPGRESDTVQFLVREVASARVGLIVRGSREAQLARGRFAPISHVVSGQDGRYDFAGVTPGEYSVVLHGAPPSQDDPYPPVFYPGAALPLDAKVLALSGAQTIENIDLVRPAALRPATVHVLVKRRDGSPVARAMVIVTDPASAIQVAASDRTDANGRLDVALFGGREYVVTASTIDPPGEVQESPQCAGPVLFVAEEGKDLEALVPDKTFHACRSAALPIAAISR